MYVIINFFKKKIVALYNNYYLYIKLQKNNKNKIKMMKVLLMKKIKKVTVKILKKKNNID